MIFEGLKDAPTSKRDGMELSGYQEAILDVVKNEDCNLIVEAVAGSGKTTTLELVAELLPRESRVAVLCFNKSVATEFSNKFPSHFECMTMHSMGLSALKFEGRVKVSGNKTRNILKYNIMQFDGDRGWNAVPKNDREFYFEHGTALVNLVSLAKGAGIREPRDLERRYMDIANHHGIDAEDSQEFASVLCSMFSMSWEKDTVVDFDDMIWKPALNHRFQLPTFDVVLVDEAQDLNVCQRLFVKKLLEKGGRLIVVGDSRQSIYGFRGADNNSMTKLRDLFNCQELPLSICYRCGSSIVEKAKEFVPQIESHASAITGTAMTIQRETFMDQVETGDFVLCRTNAPLVQLCLKLLEIGQDARIIGKDISDNLVKLAREIEKDRGVLNRYEISTYLELELAKLTEAEKFYKIRSLRENCEILLAFTGRYKTLSELKQLITKIFSAGNNKKVVRLSTIHRVKGMEADRVFIIRPDLLPLPYATSMWELEQEKNLEYVAVTRAKKELYYVEGV